jgi:hypothetical protein
MGKAPHKGDGAKRPLSPPVPPGLRDGQSPAKGERKRNEL